MHFTTTQNKVYFTDNLSCSPITTHRLLDVELFPAVLLDVTVIVFGVKKRRVLTFTQELDSPLRALEVGLIGTDEELLMIFLTAGVRNTLEFRLFLVDLRIEEDSRSC